MVYVVGAEDDADVGTDEAEEDEPDKPDEATKAVDD